MFLKLFKKERPNFEIGEIVNFIEGAFTGFSGKVIEVDNNCKKLTIQIDDFNSIAEEVKFSQVEKQQ